MDDSLHDPLQLSSMSKNRLHKNRYLKDKKSTIQLQMETQNNSRNGNITIILVETVLMYYKALIQRDFAEDV